MAKTEQDVFELPMISCIRWMCNADEKDKLIAEMKGKPHSHFPDMVCTGVILHLEIMEQHREGRHLRDIAVIDLEYKTEGAK